jgi:hypothetical protein
MENDYAVDPLNPGRFIFPGDARYSNVSLYYHLLPIYQREQQGAADNYINNVWHDYAVQLLMQANTMNIKTRPPGFRQPPNPPIIHGISLTPNYQIVTVKGPACEIPPDPDPATDVLQALPAKPMELPSYRIVKAPKSFDTFTTGGTTGAQIPLSGLGGLEGMSKDQLIALLRKLLG